MLDLLIALVSASAGLVCGRMLARSPRDAAADSSSLSTAPPPHDGETDGSPANGRETNGRETPTEAFSEKVQLVAERLRSLTVRIAEDVDQHQCRVQQVNTDLQKYQESFDAGTVADSITRLLDANQSLQSQLLQAKRRIQDQTAQIQTAETQATTDQLTRIFNRRGLDQLLEKCHREQAAGASTLMLLDVDHFKHFNDEFGHLAGDEVLREVARLLDGHLSESGVAARYGGEEFAIVFRHQPQQACLQRVETIRRAISHREIFFAGRSLRVTVSVGVAELAAEETVEQWLGRADRGLYRSKTTGRDRGHWMEGECPHPLPRPSDSGAPPADVASLRSEASCGAADASGEGGSAPPSEASALTEWGDRRVLDAESLHKVFGHMAERLETVGVRLFLAVLRSEKATGPPGDMLPLLKGILAATRALDRVGSLRSGDFVVLMPGIDEQAAVSRAQVILDALQEGDGEQEAWCREVTVGLTRVEPGLSFSEALASSSAAAIEAADRGDQRLLLSGQVAAGM